MIRSLRGKLILLILLGSLIPAVIITLLFASRLDSMRRLSKDVSSRALVGNATTMLSKLSEQESKQVELKMASLANESRVLAEAAQSAYKRPQPWKPTYPIRTIIKDKSGVYYGDYGKVRPGDLFISGRNTLSPAVRQEAVTLDELTPLLVRIAKQHQEAVYTYVVTQDSIVRGYPAPATIPELVQAGVLDPFSDFTTMPFYYVADEKHNPAKEARWTELYFDPGGNGWMFSVCTPVYVRGQMKAVSALDIAAKQISTDILNLKVGYSGYAFLANKEGMVIGYPDRAARDLGWRKGMKPDELNLLKTAHNPLRTVMEKVKPGRPVLKRIITGGTPKYVYMATVKGTDFVIGLVVPEKDVLARVHSADKQISESSAQMVREMIMLSLAVLILSISIALLYSRRMAKPIVELTRNAKQVAKGDLFNPDINLVQISGNDEISVLADAFNNMTQALRDREEDQMAMTEELRAQNEELDTKNRELNRLLGELTESEEVKDHFQALSYTDQLTGVYNRRYYEDHINGDSFCGKNQTDPCAYILLDIDNFKHVNDTYGHLAGDTVIQQISEVLLAHKRSHDVVIRFAGDEFILILKHVDLDDARLVAERIRQAVEAHECDYDGQIIRVTVSAGLTILYPGEKKKSEQVFRETDHALYRAKQLGRNRVIEGGKPKVA